MRRVDSLPLDSNSNSNFNFETTSYAFAFGTRYPAPIQHQPSSGDSPADLIESLLAQQEEIGRAHEWYRSRYDPFRDAILADLSGLRSGISLEGHRRLVFSIRTRKERIYDIDATGFRRDPSRSEIVAQRCELRGRLLEEIEFPPMVEANKRLVIKYENTFPFGTRLRWLRVESATGTAPGTTLLVVFDGERPRITVRRTLGAGMIDLSFMGKAKTDEVLNIVVYDPDLISNSRG